MAAICDVIIAQISVSNAEINDILEGYQKVMIPFPHICNESCAFQKERKNWKDLKKIQDGGQEEDIQI